MAVADMSVSLLLKSRVLWMREQGYDLRVISAAGSHATQLKQEGFPLDTLPLVRELSPVRDFASLWRLFWYFRSRRPKIVFTHTPKAGLLGPVAARLAGVPWVVHVVHGYLFHDTAPRRSYVLGWILEKHTALWSHLCLSQCREDLVAGAKSGIISRKRHKYLGNGIDVERFTPSRVNPALLGSLRARIGLPNDGFVIGFVGRLVAEKGIRELAAAFAGAVAVNPKVHLLVIGPEEADQKDAIARVDLQDIRESGRVSFTGFVADTMPYYALMDLFVLPSHREGIPRALMEACAMERPAIASDIRGCREVVIHGETGWLVPPRSVADLREAIVRASRMERCDLWAIGSRARCRILRSFDACQVNRRFKRIVDVLLRQRVG